MAEALGKIVKEINEDAPGGQYEGPDGVETAVGVRLNPRLPTPTAGLEYDPVHPHLRRGHIGELQLANRIVGALDDEIVVAHGMSAGRNGPDVISVSPDGDISVWDSKWRGRPRSIGDGAAAHQSPRSLQIALEQVRRQISEAVDSGRIPAVAAKKALENAKAGNLFINTIGTGEAHGGVVRCVRNGELADCWSN